MSEPPSPAVLDRLRRVRGFVLDMDGTLVLGDRENQGIRPLTGAVEFLDLLTAQDLRFCVFTNGTVKTPQQCADALEQAGFTLPGDSVLTPATSAVEILRRRGHRKVMVLGGTGLTEPLQAAGIETLEPRPGTTADAVLAGWYRQELTFESLEAAVGAVSAGAEFFSASQSPYFATAEGRSLGSSRAISAVVHDITGCPVTVVGKPSRQALEVAARHLGMATDELAVVGDDPELEVPMAHAGGALAVAVHTGLGEAGSFAGLPEEARPHLDLPDVAALGRLLALR